MTNKTENKERFLNLLKSVPREGINDLCDWLENHSDFFDAPASTMYHGSYPGGLCEHSLHVYDNLVMLDAVYNVAPEPRKYELILVSLLHDLCKTNCYKKTVRNVKNPANGQWEQKDAYSFEELISFGGHGSKSVYLAMMYIKLTSVEASAINSHMSTWGGEAANVVSSCYKQNKLAWALHVADEAATFIDEVD